MPISNYDSLFGGQKGAAQKALDAMIKQYGEKQGKSVFYGKVAKLQKANQSKKG